MDPVTHGATGAVLGRTFFRERLGRFAGWAGFLAMLWPDVDIFLRFFGQEFYFRNHRGITNSIIFFLPSALLAAAILKAIFRRMRYRDLFLLALLSVVIHTFMDLITSYGTMIFWPLSLVRPTLDLVFIIDLIMTGIFVVTLVLMLFLQKREKLLGRGAFAVFAILLPEAHSSEAVAWRWLLLAVAVPASYAIHHNFTARCWPEGSDSYQVVSGVIWGMVIFGERPSPLMWLSALLLIASLYLIGLRRGREETEVAEET